VSWKATAFVKDLRRNLTVTEKFVLLVLADYHNTDERETWPSMPTLAADCLMEERSVREIIGRLVEKGFLFRVTGGGRGRKNAYKFIGLDVKKGEQETLIVETGFQQTGSRETRRKTLIVGAQNPEQPAMRNKEERVLTKNRLNPDFCWKCEGTKQIVNPGPGKRIIPCPDCQPSAVSA
jgi:Helix-turn-helix domain